MNRKPEKKVFLWDIYFVEGGVRKYLGSTRAVSAEKARNNMRFRIWGHTPEDKLGLTLVVEKKDQMRKRARVITRREMRVMPTQLFLPGVSPSRKNATFL